MSISISNLALAKSQRALILGGTGSGKSTLSERLILQFRMNYPESKILILDSKPRFRAEWTPQGIKASRRYRNWDHGPTIPESVAINNLDEFKESWGRNYSVFIAQVTDDNDDVSDLTFIAQEFFKRSRASIPQLLVVDEGMDFYTESGSPIRGTLPAIKRTSRAGRERGMALLFCSQRARNIPVQIMSEMSKLYLFRLDYTEDVKRLREMGVPPIESPLDNHQFKYWTKATPKKIYGPYTLGRV